MACQVQSCLIDDGEADLGRRGQHLGEVLHHALQACAALEDGLGGVLVPERHRDTMALS